MGTRSKRPLWLAMSLAVAGLTLAACGSSSGAPASGAPTSGALTGGGATTAAGPAVTIATATGPAGTYLADGAGRALYLWAADTGTASTCDGACASVWPPLLTKGAPAAATGVQAGEIGTTKRSDGGTQVTYDGHPLYYFAGDKGAGQTNGQGSNGFGAKWWIVNPSGSAITGPASTPSKPNSGGSQY